jgi:hypothetical protein
VLQDTVITGREGTAQTTRLAVAAGGAPSVTQPVTTRGTVPIHAAHTPTLVAEHHVEHPPLAYALTDLFNQE